MPHHFLSTVILFCCFLFACHGATTIAALDTGSSFEGMGAAREVTFSCLAEPTLFFALITLARMSKSLSLSTILTHPTPAIWFAAGASMLLLIGALFVTLLVENCRIPFDDPNTHLELTMIHEVMVLDHSGRLSDDPLCAALKLFILGVFVNVVFPLPRKRLSIGHILAAMLVLAVAIGTVESVMA
jgi:formate hydrogenlyase subunit 4